MISNVIAALGAGRPRALQLRIAGWGLWIAVLTLVFSPVLLSVIRHAYTNSLHSHIPLVPLIAGYLIYLQPKRPIGTKSAGLSAAMLLCAGALGVVAAAVAASDRLSVNDYLAAMTFAFVSLVWAGGFLALGTGWMQAHALPLAFLLFMIPMPDALVSALESASVRGSADVAAALFTLTGTPLLRDGTVFALPGITLEVGRECSGIRSSWVLFITSVAASQLLLARPWSRLVLVAFVIPLAIVRNAVRIATIGTLAVYVGPHMVDSAIHRQGGPLFFALSLVPLFALSWFLRRHERLNQAKA